MSTQDAPAKDTDRYFEEIAEGETYVVNAVRTITEADVTNFAGISGDYHPLHVSAEVAAESAFDARIAHGNLVFSIAEALIADMNPKSFSYGYNSLRFTKPVPIGTTISVRREIIKTKPYDENRGRVVYKYEVTDEADETVLICQHITLVKRNPDPE